MKTPELQNLPAHKIEEAFPPFISEMLREINNLFGLDCKAEDQSHDRL